jgi:ParB family transcriptional regulator, chromosome partitioning protein
MSKPMKAKSRLGRGLSSLMGMNEDGTGAVSDPAFGAPAVTAAIPDTAETSASPAVTSEAGLPDSGMRVVELSVDSVLPNPHQPRREFNEASIAELATSLRSTGLIQPVLVRPRPGGVGYELIAGERRLRAAKVAGLTTLPAIVREVDRYTQAQMALVENIQREDLNAMDRAYAYRVLVQELGLTQNELAGRLGEDRSSVANYLRLLDLAEPVQELVRAGSLTMGHAKLLAGVSDPIEQKRLADRVVSANLTVRNLERLLQEPVQPTPAESAKEGHSTAHLKDLEKTLSGQLGVRVNVKQGPKHRGKVVLHYANLDQFDQLIERLGVVLE